LVEPIVHRSSESLLIRYSYNDEGNLAKEEQWDRRSVGRRGKWKNILLFKSIDSVLTDFQWHGYVNRTYYDSLGLKKQTIYNGHFGSDYEYSTRDL